MWNNKIRIMIMMMWMMMNRNYPLNVNPYQFLMRIAPPASINAITSKPASRTHQNHQPHSISKVIIHCCGLWNCLLFPTPGIDFWLHFYLQPCALSCLRTLPGNQMARSFPIPFRLSL